MTTANYKIMDPQDFDPEFLDPGIRRVVVWLRSLGFRTTDSGDGVSKPPEDRSLGDRPHVFMVVDCDNFFAEVDRLSATVRSLGIDSGGWDEWDQDSDAWPPGAVHVQGDYGGGICTIHVSGLHEGNLPPDLGLPGQLGAAADFAKTTPFELDAVTQALSDRATAEQLVDLELERTETSTRVCVWDAIDALMPSAMDSPKAEAIDVALDKFAAAVRKRPRTFDAEKIIAFDLGRGEPASTAIHDCIRRLEAEPYRAPLELADLLTREVEDWQRMALDYQGRHAQLRGLQLAVMAAVSQIEQRHDFDLDPISDALIKANSRSASPPGELDSEEVERLAELAWPIMATEGMGAANSQWPPRNESWAIGMRKAIAALVREIRFPPGHPPLRGALARVPLKPPPAEPSKRREPDDVRIVIAERPWVKATDPIVETWVGRRVELTSAHTAPWIVELFDADAENLYTAEPDRCAHERNFMLEVRLHDDCETAKEPKS